MLNDRSRFLRGSSYREESSFLARVIVCRAEGGAKRIEEHLVYDTRADVARVRQEQAADTLNLVNIACVDVSFQLQDLREGEGERC